MRSLPYTVGADQAEVTTMGLDRKAANTALAKVIAYDACGKPQEADAWTVRLLETLGRADMIGGGFAAEREGATR